MLRSGDNDPNNDIVLNHILSSFPFIIPLEGNETRQEYDGNGNVVKATAPDGGEISFSYDVLDRLISYVDAEVYPFSIEYDACGNMVKATDGCGNNRRTEHDALNNELSI